MNQLLQRAKELNPEIVSHRRRFHQNPELGLHLPKTSAYICEQLEKMGYQPQRIGDSSILAAVGNGDKTFLLRADMDALPIHEETGLPFSSCVEGCMHACGHDCHAAMLLGAAKLLKEQESCLQGKVWLFFQAGEEILDGAKEALDDGLLEKTHADAAMMIHILSGSPIPAGSICFPAQNGCYASADWYRIDVSGKGGHGAMPQNTISSVNTICAVNAGIQEIMSVGIEPAANAVMTVGELHAGFAGSGNIIPDSAYLAGTIRTFDEGVREKIKASLIQMADNTAAAHGANAKVTFSHSAPIAWNDPQTRAFAFRSVQNLLGERATLDLEQVLGGKFALISASEDFAYISQKIPSAILLLAAGTPAEGYTAPGHNPKTNFNEDVLYIGSACYAAVAMDRLKENH